MGGPQEGTRQAGPKASGEIGRGEGSSAAADQRQVCGRERRQRRRQQHEQEVRTGPRTRTDCTGSARILAGRIYPFEGHDEGEPLAPPRRLVDWRAQSLLRSGVANDRMGLAFRVARACVARAHSRHRRPVPMALCGHGARGLRRSRQPPAFARWRRCEHRDTASNPTALSDKIEARTPCIHTFWT